MTLVNEFLIVGIILLIVLMCLHVVYALHTKQISEQGFLIWFLLIFLTGPVGYILFLIMNKSTMDKVDR